MLNFVFFCMLIISIFKGFQCIKQIIYTHFLLILIQVLLEEAMSEYKLKQTQMSENKEGRKSWIVWAGASRDRLPQDQQQPTGSSTNLPFIKQNMVGADWFGPTNVGFLRRPEFGFSFLCFKRAFGCYFGIYSFFGLERDF